MDDEAEWASTVTAALHDACLVRRMEFLRRMDASYWYQRRGQIKIRCLLHALLKEVQEWIAVIWRSDRVRRSCRSS
jgi:hypothetical protein